MGDRTHWDECWKSGPEHYECAVAVAKDAHKAQRQAENDLSKYMARCAMAEAEVERLRSVELAASRLAADHADEVCDAAKLRAEVERLRAMVGEYADCLQNLCAKRLHDACKPVSHKWLGRKHTDCIREAVEFLIDRAEAAEAEAGRLRAALQKIAYLQHDIGRPPLISEAEAMRIKARDALEGK